MAKAIIPLILPPTARGWAKSIGTSAKDQQLINGVYETNGKDVYATKRAGSSTGTSIGSGVIATRHYSSFFSGQFLATSTGFFDDNATNLGTLDSAFATSQNYELADSQVGGVGILAWATGAGTGWFLYSNAITTNFPTFSGDTHTNTVIDGIASTTGLYPGQAISGTGIQAGTRIATITSSTAITVTLATTGTATVTITKQAISKIIDADFPSSVNSVVAMNGRFFWGSSNGRISQSAINDPSSYTAGQYVTADYSGDQLLFIFKLGTYIVASGTFNTLQYYSYGQNSYGSVLNLVGTVNGFQLPYNAPIYLSGESYCIAQTSDSTNANEQLGLYKISGLGLQRVSNDLWSSIITGNFAALLGIARIGDKSLLVIVSSASTFIIYDPSVNDFSILTLSAAITSSNGTIFTKSGSSTYFSWANNNTWQDSSVAYTMTAQTEPKLPNNGMGFTVNYVDLIADIEASGTATLSKSTDDGATWTDVGTFDMTLNKKRVNAVGSADASMALRVTHSANTGFRATKLIVDYMPGTL